MNKLETSALGGIYALIDGKAVAGSPDAQTLQNEKIAIEQQRAAETAVKTAASGKEAGETKKIEIADGVLMEFVWVAPGTFKMGSDDAVAAEDEKPVREVTLTEGYWLGKYEVTQKEWDAVEDCNPSRFRGGRHPVECVSWNDCQEFVRKVNENLAKTGEVLRVRLPSEAEWEFAARGGTKSRGGDDEKFWDNAVWDPFGENGTGKVGEGESNALGLHDMIGNVWEWCQDFYGAYSGDDATDPEGPDSGDRHIMRGGCWRGDMDDLRPSSRAFDGPDRISNDVGFRLAADATEKTRRKLEEAQMRKAEAEARRKALEESKRKLEIAESKTRHAGETRMLQLAPGLAMKFVWVAPGTFNEWSEMGKGGRKVTLTKGYWIGMYEVTNKQWRTVTTHQDERFKSEVNPLDDQRPVEGISWNYCQIFIKEVNGHLARDGEALRVRLPTEAEWEFAARGGTKSKGFKYSGSDNAEEVSWHCYSGRMSERESRGTHAVGMKKANELGIFDMTGNVNEWCQDWYKRASRQAVTDPVGPKSGDERVIRGGSWQGWEKGLDERGADDPDDPWELSCGFRLVAVVS